MDTRKTVNRRIEEYRTSVLCITQEEFAVRLGMEPKKGRSTVNNWEQGAVQVKSDDLCRIASTFGVSVDYLLGLEDFPVLEHSARIAHNVTGLSSDTLAFLEKYKDDEGGPEWKIIRMVEKLIKHPDILCNLCIVEERASSIASDIVADPVGFYAKMPDEWPDEQKRLFTVQEWETSLDAALFNVSNTAVRFAEVELGVRDVREALSKEDRDLQEILRESEQEG